MAAPRTELGSVVIEQEREKEKQTSADQVHDAQYVLIGVKCVLKLNAYECQFK